MRQIILTLLSAFAIVWTAEALADPPAHAPAHGWRQKHDPHYIGYTGTAWDRDYDIRSGHCNRDEIGAVLGGVAGGVIGSQIGDGNRTVATIVGVAVGALIGSRIGRALDDRDRACVGHALEIGSVGHNVTWQNAGTGVNYTLVPGEGRKSQTGTCRDFTLVAVAGKQKSSQNGLACQSKQGVWQIMNAQR